MIKEHGSRVVNEGSGTTTDFDVNNRFEQYKNDGCICSTPIWKLLGCNYLV